MDHQMTVGYLKKIRRNTQNHQQKCIKLEGTNSG